MILYVLYIVTTFLPGRTTSALHHWTKGLLPREAWYIQTSLGQHVNEAIIGTLEGWKVGIMELGIMRVAVYIFMGNIYSIEDFPMFYLERWIYEPNFNGTQSPK